MAQRCKEDTAVKVSIAVGKSYSITEEDERDTMFKNSFTSTDSSVAVLRDGKYILGIRAGKAQITVTNDEKEKVYDVTVSAGSNQANRSVESIETENDIKIGYGYNAMAGEELNEYALTKPLFDWSKILKSDELLMDDSKVVDTKSFNGSTLDEFLDSYSKKTTVQITVKVFGIKVYGKRKEFSELNINHTKNVVDINQIYLQIQKKAYYFPEDENGYASYVLPSVWKKLIGTDEKKTTVGEFIQEYGTHVLTSGIYGGSFEWNYVLSDSDKCMLNDSCMCLYDYLRQIYDTDGEILQQLDRDMKGYILKHPEVLNRAMLQGADLLDDSAWIDCHDLAQYFYQIGEKKYGMNTSRKFLGDGKHYANSSVSGQSFDQTLSDYLDWYDALEDGVLIGPMDRFSLYPVWELIPSDTKEGQARRKEFETFIKKQA